MYWKNDIILSGMVKYKRHVINGKLLIPRCFHTICGSQITFATLNENYNAYNSPEILFSLATKIKPHHSRKMWARGLGFGI